MTQLTASGKELTKLQTQIDDAKDEYDTLYGDYESEKKKTTFWQWATGICSAVLFVGGLILGISI